MDRQFVNLSRRVDRYREALANTEAYREAWKEGLADQISEQLMAASQAVGLEGELIRRADVENLGALVFTLGDTKSGMVRQVGRDVQRNLIKHNGSLIYQQLFNGKVMVMIQMPYIEEHGQAQPAQPIAIYRPEELAPPYIVRHLEELVLRITEWEDYDDEDPNQTIGFDLNFGGAPDAD